MNKEMISSFLTSMFEDRNLFIEVNGVKSLMDAKHMLVADALSENINLFSEVIGEYINKNFNNMNTLGTFNSKALAI